MSNASHSEDWALVESMVHDFDRDVERCEDENAFIWASNIDKVIAQRKPKIEKLISTLSGEERELAFALLDETLGEAYDAKTAAHNKFSASDDVHKTMVGIQEVAARHYASSYDRFAHASAALGLSGCFVYLKRTELAKSAARLALAHADSEEARIAVKKKLLELDAWPCEPLEDGTTATSLVDLLDRKGAVASTPEVQRLAAANRGADPTKTQWSKIVVPGIAVVVSLAFFPLLLVTVPWFIYAWIQANKP